MQVTAYQMILHRRRTDIWRRIDAVAAQERAKRRAAAKVAEAAKAVEQAKTAASAEARAALIAEQTKMKMIERWPKVFSDVPTVYDITPADKIIRAVSKEFGVMVSDIKSKTKTQDIAIARQVAMFVLRSIIPLSFAQIGKKLGGRDFSTIEYGCSKIERLVTSDADFGERVNKIVGSMSGTFIRQDREFC
jgi:chromosomal replication initiation ATPase DnaA